MGGRDQRRLRCTLRPGRQPPQIMACRRTGARQAQGLSRHGPDERRTPPARVTSKIFSMLSPSEIAGLPVEEYGFPGPLRDALVEAILDGRKTSTTSLVVQYKLEDQPLPVVGERGVVVDSLGRPVCITEVTEVRVVPLGTVDEAHAIDEGEGYRAVSDWRAGHEEFWHSTDFRAALHDPSFTVSDSTEAVLVRFRVPAQR